MRYRNLGWRSFIFFSLQFENILLSYGFVYFCWEFSYLTFVPFFLESSWCARYFFFLLICNICNIFSVCDNVFSSVLESSQPSSLRVLLLPYYLSSLGFQLYVTIFFAMFLICITLLKYMYFPLLLSDSAWIFSSDINSSLVIFSLVLSNLLFNLS